MDYKRANNIELMRFPGVGEVLVRWFDTDKPWLPVPHAFGEWRWWREEDSWMDFDDGAVGGITTYPWRFADGTPPPPPALQCTGFRGSPAAWLGEDTGERYDVFGYGGFDPSEWDFLTMGG